MRNKRQILDFYKTSGYQNVNSDSDSHAPWNFLKGVLAIWMHIYLQKDYNNDFSRTVQLAHFHE